MDNVKNPENPLNHKTKNENIQTFRDLIKNNWLDSITIEIQEEKTDLLIITHIIYKITYTLNDPKKSKFEIFRRFNDFKYFRIAIKSYLPCLIIYPLKSTNANRRLSLGKGDEKKLRKKRLTSLKYFLEFLKENKEKSKIEPFLMFLDPLEKETEIGNKLRNLKKEDFHLLLLRYKQFYPTLKNIDDNKLKENLLNFKNSIEMNIEFFYQMKIVSDKMLLNKKEFIHNESSKKFFEMILVPFFKKKEEFDKIRDININMVI